MINNPPPLCKVSMWVQLQIPRIEDGNNFGVAVQVILKLISFLQYLRIDKTMTFKWKCCKSIGKGIRAAYQHPHQDRRIPDTDHKVSDVDYF